jgi:hypothetical protein
VKARARKNRSLIAALATALLVCFCVRSSAQLRNHFLSLQQSQSAHAAAHLGLTRHTVEEVRPRIPELPTVFCTWTLPLTVTRQKGAAPRIAEPEGIWRMPPRPVSHRIPPPSADSSDPFSL